MPRVDKLVDKMSKMFGQVFDLPTISTLLHSTKESKFVLCTRKTTAHAQQPGCFTHPFLAIFYLVRQHFYSLSTKLINNTNLIKEY